MAAPIGNRNARKGKIFSDALRKAMIDDDFYRVKKAANQLLDLAAAGEPWAIKELADRLDGKPINEGLYPSNSELSHLPNIQVSFVQPIGSMITYLD
jgi:hypothetical protein